MPPDGDEASPGIEGMPPGGDEASPGEDGMPPGVEGMPPGVEGIPLGVEGMPPGVEGAPPGFDGDGMLGADEGEEDGEDEGEGGDGVLGNPPAEGEDGELLGLGGIGMDCGEFCDSQAAKPTTRPQASASRIGEAERMMSFRISQPSTDCACRSCHP